MSRIFTQSALRALTPISVYLDLSFRNLPVFRISALFMSVENDNFSWCCPLGEERLKAHEEIAHITADWGRYNSGFSEMCSYFTFPFRFLPPSLLFPKNRKQKIQKRYSSVKPVYLSICSQEWHKENLKKERRNSPSKLTEVSGRRQGNWIYISKFFSVMFAVLIPLPPRPLTGYSEAAVRFPYPFSEITNSSESGPKQSNDSHSLPCVDLIRS